MRIASTISEFRQLRSESLAPHPSLALVPTMGALHEGHLSLVRQAREAAQQVVVSIFVNPTQFGLGEDYELYPRPLAQDVALLEQEKVGFLFLPSAAELYPPGFRTYVNVEEMSDRLCGHFRPSHFRGVTTVVLKLLHIVQPDLAFFGQKDAQQCIIIRRMVEDLNLGVGIVVAPTVREPDGLAISSRNRYLSREERRAATVLFQSLQEAQRKVTNGEYDADRILQGVRESIAREPLARLQYAEIVNPHDLSEVRRVEGEALLLLAVFVGNTRLIDNTSLRAEQPPHL
jgi:pantoate--beta-alanine ligase